MTDYGINRDGGFPIASPFIVDFDVEVERICEEERSRWDEATVRYTEAQEQVERAAKERERIVLRLQSLGLGFRRIAAVLGVTHHQQVDQIARRAKKRHTPSEIPEP